MLDSVRPTSYNIYNGGPLKPHLYTIVLDGLLGDHFTIKKDTRFVGVRCLLDA